MKLEEAAAKREQVIRDGYCVIDEILSGEFLQELQDKAYRLMEHHVMADDSRYQGRHVVTQGKDNEVIQRLLD